MTKARIDARFASLKAEGRAAATTESMFYTCRFFWFRQFYRDDYEAAMRAREGRGAHAAAPIKGQGDGQQEAGR